MTPFSARHLRLSAIALAAAACVTVAADISGPLRAITVLGFLLAGPGLAITPVLRLDSAVGQGAAAVGVSLATLIIVSEALVYAQVSSAGWMLAIVAVGTLGASVPPMIWGKQS